MDIQTETVAEFKTGYDTVGTSAQAAGPDFPCKKYVRIKADLSNSDNVYVGHSEQVSTTNGFQLDAGEHVDIPVDSLGKVWVIGGDTDQGYSFLAV